MLSIPPKQKETISSTQQQKNNTQKPTRKIRINSWKNRRNLSLAFLFFGLLFFRLFLLPRHRMASKVENWPWGFFSTMANQVLTFLALKIHYYSNYTKYTCNNTFTISSPPPPKNKRKHVTYPQMLYVYIIYVFLFFPRSICFTLLNFGHASQNSMGRLRSHKASWRWNPQSPHLEPCRPRFSPIFAHVHLVIPGCPCVRKYVINVSCIVYIYSKYYIIYIAIWYHSIFDYIIINMISYYIISYYILCHYISLQYISTTWISRNFHFRDF